MKYFLFFCFALGVQVSYSQQLPDTTFANILADPDKYQGKEVVIFGYVNFEFEGDEIVLDTLDRRNRLFVGSMATELLPIKHFQYWNGRRVIMQGVFDKNNRGHLGMYKGTITDVMIMKLVD